MRRSASFGPQTHWRNFRAALASASAAANIRGDPVSALPAKQALFGPSHTIFKFTGSKR
jgi:hypothetical protein